MKAKWLVGLSMAAAFLVAPLGARAAGERIVELTVTKNGFEPARVSVAKGFP